MTRSVIYRVNLGRASLKEAQRNSSIPCINMYRKTHAHKIYEINAGFVDIDFPFHLR